MQTPKVVPFKDLRFGKTSAEKESEVWPDLLTEGYFDPYGFIRSAREKGPFLFLGYKGSGKSAIGEHLRLTAANEPQTFVKYLSLGDFPYTPFSKLIRGDIEPEAKYPMAWSWLILLQVIDQLAQDLGSSLQSDNEASEALSKLRHAGLLPSSNLSHIVQVTTKKSFGLNLKYLQAGREELSIPGSISDVPFLVEKLKELVFRTRSRSKHLIVIDGLDEILTKRERQYESLAALMYEADRLNGQFSRLDCPVKIVVLCRTDLYEHLPNANKNKVRQDSAVHLDWYHDPDAPENSNLVKLANYRASLAVGVPIDIFNTYLPKSVQSARAHGDTDTRRFLLDCTRHTPRDFITLLNFIQKYSGDSTAVSNAQVVSAVRAYSNDYFVPEVKDELHGYLSPDQIDHIVALFSALGKREFSFSELEDCSKNFNSSLNVDLQEALRLLFNCSAMGNLERAGGTTYFTMKYRNRYAVLNLGKKLILHRGMWKALSLK